MAWLHHLTGKPTFGPVQRDQIVGVIAVVPADGGLFGVGRAENLREHSGLGLGQTASDRPVCGSRWPMGSKHF